MIISFKFLAILLIAFCGYWLIPSQKVRNIFLILVSLFFIGIHDCNAMVLVIVLTLFIHVIGTGMVNSPYKKRWHRSGLIGLLLILIAFKYLGLLSKSLNDLLAFFGALPLFKIENLLLPLGISYIVFKYISYITDLYWERIKRGSFFNLLLYGSLFTIFVAGPIERFKNLAPQIKLKQTLSLSLIENGSFRIVFGLFKKLVIADWLGFFINPVFHNIVGYNWAIKTLALFGYSIQIYMDFAGYSDIAIGTSRLFGLTIMENFDWPYLRSNISEFWKGWHISLSLWIRDYIFLPFSSYSDKKIWLFVAMPLISMGLCGLWHGASWNFLLWGLWHGFGISIHQSWRLLKRKNKKIMKVCLLRGYVMVATLITFSYVTVGWIFFK